MLIGDSGIYHDFICVNSKSHFKGKIHFFGVIFAFRYGLHAGIKLLHGSYKLLKSLLFLFFVGTRR